MLLLATMFIFLMIYSPGLAYGDNRLVRGMKKMREELPFLEKKVGFLHGIHKHGSFRQHRKELREKCNPKLEAEVDDTRPTAPGHSPGIGHHG